MKLTNICAYHVFFFYRWLIYAFSEESWNIVYCMPMLVQVIKIHHLRFSIKIDIAGKKYSRKFAKLIIVGWKMLRFRNWIAKDRSWVLKTKCKIWGISSNLRNVGVGALASHNSGKNIYRRLKTQNVHLFQEK